jgi:cytochrome c-type biogenesis protein CcmE
MGLKMKKHRTKLILITVVAMAVIGYLVYTGITDTMVYYLTVSELVQNGSQPSDGGLRVGGTVLDGSVVWDPKDLKLRFTMGDEGGATLPVVYQGVVPDSFKQGRELIIEGIYADGKFTATQLMPTCPSKYE